MIRTFILALCFILAILLMLYPAVIKMEYYLGKKSWWIWLVVGVLVACASLFVPNQTVSTILGGFAFSCFWGILEMHQQEQRVVKGWFPENPKRHDYYEALRKNRCL